MVSEEICLEIIQMMSGHNITMTETFHPGQEDESKRENIENNAMAERQLYMPLLIKYDLFSIEAAIKWLKLGGFVGITEWGLRGPWVYILTEIGLKVAKEKQFSEEDKTKLYQINPYQVFVAQQFNSEDEELVSYLKNVILEPNGYKVVDGKAEGLEEFRQSILGKIEKSKLFICLLTKRKELQSGNFVSSVWLYQEIGAAIAFGKKPLLLVEEGIDPDFVGELQKTYEYLEFNRSNHPRIFKKILDRFNAEMMSEGIPIPSK